MGNEGHYIEVVAKEEMLNGKNGILMTFVVGKIDQAGKRTVLSAPQIFANENQKAQVTVGNTGQPEVSVSVMAERKAL